MEEDLCICCGNEVSWCTCDYDCDPDNDDDDDDDNYDDLGW